MSKRKALYFGQVISGCVLFVSLWLMATAAPTSHDLAAEGGIITSDAGSVLLLASSQTSNVDGQTQAGIFAMQSPAPASGDLQHGATFAQGGLVSIVAPGDTLAFQGSFSSATWQLVTLANGTHFYTLTVTLANGAGAFVLVTGNVGRSLWNGAGICQSVNVHLD